jgi:hypothetical protein
VSAPATCLLAIVCVQGELDRAQAEQARMTGALKAADRKDKMIKF